MDYINTLEPVAVAILGVYAGRRLGSMLDVTIIYIKSDDITKWDSFFDFIKYGRLVAARQLSDGQRLELRGWWMSDDDKAQCIELMDIKVKIIESGLMSAVELMTEGQ